MRAVRLRQPAGLERLVVDDTPASRTPGPGEVRVRVHASSLNFHDYVVVTGGIATPDGRIPMSDGGGVVLEVGAGVGALAAGDRVMSVFFPDWAGGRATPENTRTLPGDRHDGFACEEVTAPASWFTRAPAGYSHAEAATLPCAALTAWRALIGVLAGREGPVSTVRLMAGQMRVQGLMVGSREDQLAMVRAIEANGIRPVIDREFALDELGAAFAHQAAGRHFGKIVLRCAAE